jgi:thiol-disulfide isomerase/thioredoxin
VISSQCLYAQTYDDDYWKNPSVIWKTSSGSIITAAFAKKMYTQGSYTMVERALRGGRKEVKMIPQKKVVKIPKSFNWNDPNLVVRDENGQIIPIRMTRLLRKLKSVEWSTDTLETGSFQVTFQLGDQGSSEWNEPRMQFIKDWVDQWKGHKLPEFALKDLDGEIVNNNIAKNKIVVLNFWNTKCDPCIKTMNQLNRVAEVFYDEEILFLAPNYEPNGMINFFLEDQKFNFRVLGSAQSLYDMLGLGYYPTHMIVDKNGVIIDINVGSVENIEKELGIKLSRLVAFQ